MRSLERQGFQPVKVWEEVVSGTVGSSSDKQESKEGGKSFAWFSKPHSNKKVSEGPVKLKKAQVVLFTEELSDMLEAGLQLEPALKAMESRSELGPLKELATRVRQLVRDGMSFSHAIARVSPSFGGLYCSLAHAGEAAGALDVILARQAEYLKNLHEMQGRITTALIYPAFLVVTAIIVAVIFVTSLIPELINIVASSPGAEVPAMANVLMGFSSFVKQWWVVMLLFILACVFLFKAWRDNEANHPKWDEIKATFPLVKGVVRSRFYVQFLETMSNLTGNGLTLVRALELTCEATPNLFFKQKLEEVLKEVGDGRSFSRSLVRCGIFPSLLTDMVAVGEQIGDLSKSLRRAAERFDKELNKALQRVMAFIMPVILFLMAILVGTMLWLMVSALFQTMENLGGVR